MQVKLNIDAIDGNAFVILGSFRKAALRQGYSVDEVNAVLEEAKSGDYDHLLQVMLEHTVADDDEY